MLYTLTGTAGSVGATRDELIRSALRPGNSDINEFEGTLLAFRKYASHFWIEGTRHYFDLKENPDASVELESLKYGDPAASALLRDTWRDEIFREQRCAIFADASATREALDAMDKHGIRWCLAPRRLRPEERHGLYFGLSLRNQVILLEPHDEQFNLDRHPDLLKWAKRAKAADDLARNTADRDRREAYERIGREDRKHITDTIRRAGLVFTHFEQFGNTPRDVHVEFEPLGNARTKDEVLQKISTAYFPEQIVAEHIFDRLADVEGKTVAAIEQEYRNTLGFPIIMSQSAWDNAIRQLCKDSKVGIRHQRGNQCGKTPDLGDNELAEATVTGPFARQEPPPVGPPPVGPPRPPVGPEPPVGPPVGPAPVRIESVSVPPQRGIGALRQEVAVRLQAFPDGKVTRIRFQVYLEQSVGDLSTLPAGIRGSLSGPGDLIAEITITKSGEFSKAEVEQMIEKLPLFSGADYSATLTVAIRQEAGA